MGTKAQTVQGWLNGERLSTDFLSKHAKLLILIAVLVMIYILSGYSATKQINQLEKLKKEVESTHVEALTMTAQRVELTRQSKVATQLQESGSYIEKNKRPTILVK